MPLTLRLMVVEAAFSREPAGGDLDYESTFFMRGCPPVVDWTPSCDAADVLGHRFSAILTTVAGVPPPPASCTFPKFIISSDPLL